MACRRPDQYYFHLYDRQTIAKMKLKEKVEVEELAAIPESDAEKKREVSRGHFEMETSEANRIVGLTGWNWSQGLWKRR